MSKSTIVKSFNPETNEYIYVDVTSPIVNKEDLEYLDMVGLFDVEYNTVEEWKKYVRSTECVEYFKKVYGTITNKIPVIHKIKINGEDRFIFLQPEKMNIEMDWKFYAGLEPITKEAIQKETNIEKRRLLMFEYGIDTFFEGAKTLHKDAYGEYIVATIDKEKTYWLKVKNGTTATGAVLEQLQQKKGSLSPDNKKYYYIPTKAGLKTCREGVALSWGLKEKDLPEKGFAIET